MKSTELKKDGWYWMECVGSDPERYMVEFQSNELFINGENVDKDEWQDAKFYGPVPEPDWD